MNARGGDSPRRTSQLLLYITLVLVAFAHPPGAPETHPVLGKTQQSLATEHCCPTALKHRGKARFLPGKLPRERAATGLREGRDSSVAVAPYRPSTSESGFAKQALEGFAQVAATQGF